MGERIVINKAVEDLIDEFKKLNEVEGILLAGSRATGSYDKESDYDIYIYINNEISIEKRKAITEKYFNYIEINNTFWEAEDDGFLKEDNIPVEIIYRNLDWIDQSLDTIVNRHEASTGYTTCFWSNFINSKILYDRNGSLAEMQNKYKVVYPEALRESIIRKNYPLLKQKMPAYYFQIEKALKREDLIGVNHRVAAFLASYFDIIFAINKFLHPGEKKTIKIIKENKLRVPKDMEINIENILQFCAAKDSKILDEIDELISNLDNLLKEEASFYWY